MCVRVRVCERAIIISSFQILRYKKKNDNRILKGEQPNHLIPGACVHRKQSDNVAILNAFLSKLFSLSHSNRQQ